MALSPDDRRARMEALRRKFLDQLPEMARAALSAFERAAERSAGPEALDDARRRLHTLAGTLGTFGYLALMKEVRLLEDAVRPEAPPTAPADAASATASLRAKIQGLVLGGGRPDEEVA